MTDLRDRYRGCLLGLAVGDAVGTTLEFESPGDFEPIDDMVGGGPFDLQPGQWTDDTSMALCLAQSLIDKGGFDAQDQMRRYVKWYTEGEMSSTGECFDIGNTTRRALQDFRHTGNPYSGSNDPHTAGNGSIMRLAPIPMAYRRVDPAQLGKMASLSSSTTHAAAVCLDSCRFMSFIIANLLNGASKETVLSDDYAKAYVAARFGDHHSITNGVAAVVMGSYKHKEPPYIIGDGYVVSTLEAALWAFYKTTDFKSGCLKVVNLGLDADTTGAVYGQIAGAYYGASGIPREWLEKVSWSDDITAKADRLLALSESLADPSLLED